MVALWISWLAYHHSPFFPTASLPCSRAIGPSMGSRLTTSSDQNSSAACSNFPSLQRVAKRVATAAVSIFCLSVMRTAAP